MPELIERRPGEDVTDILAGPTIAPLGEEQLRRHAPDVHLALVGNRGTLLARASCWWTDTPSLPGCRVGVIGHYAAEDDESGVRLLNEACARLAREGCSCIVGPMDGNTWRSYRLVIDRGEAPPFFLEPVNPEAWPRQFERAGFEVLATYSSALAEDLTQVDPRITSAEARLQRNGISIRSLRLDHAEEELRRIFHLSLGSFTRNFLYTPISEQEFLEQNRRVLPLVNPDLVLLAERGDTLVGFLFSLPDVLQSTAGRRGTGPSPAVAGPSVSSGHTPDTIIIKTVAVSPGSAHAGLGSVLVASAQQRAHALGFRRAIHALMHEQNVSRNISHRYASPMRRYALFIRRAARCEAPQ